MGFDLKAKVLPLEKILPCNVPHFLLIKHREKTVAEKPVCVSWHLCWFHSGNLLLSCCFFIPIITPEYFPRCIFKTFFKPTAPLKITPKSGFAVSVSVEHALYASTFTSLSHTRSLYLAGFLTLPGFSLPLAQKTTFGFHKSSKCFSHFSPFRFTPHWSTNFEEKPINPATLYS